MLQIQKTADSLKRATAQLEQQKKSLTGNMESQSKELNQKVFAAQQEADQVSTFPPPLVFDVYHVIM